MTLISPATRIAASVVALTTACLIGTAPAQDWARFRGPDGAGVADLPGLPTTLAPENADWDLALGGSGHSSPVVIWDRVYVTIVPDGKPEHREIVCVSATEGKVLWRDAVPFKPYTKHRFNSYAASTPTVDENGVYVCWGEEGDTAILAWDHEGKLLWRQSLGAFAAQHGAGPSIVIADGVLIVPKENRDAQSFVAGLDPSNGETLWKTPMSGNQTPYATPTVRRVGDRQEVIFASTSNGIYSLDPKSGEENWTFDHGFRQRCVASAVVMGDRIFTSSGQGSGGRESAAIRLGENGNDPKLIYRIDRGLPYVPTPVYHDGLLFIVSDGGIASCHDAETGEAFWRERVCGEIYASPILVNEHLYLFSRTGEAVVLRAGKSFEKVSAHEWEAPIHATPAVASNRLFLRTDSRLICIKPGS